MGEKYGAPLCVIHRADLQNILLQSITSLPVPVQIHLDSKVISLDPDFGARIQLQSGEWVEGDVVICADGVKSSLRQYFLAPRSESNVEQGQEKERNKLQPTPTGDAAYRILIPRSKVEGDANALQLLENSVGMRWMGPGGHVMAYPIRDNTLYNMVLLHPQKPQIYHETGLIENCWTCKGSKTDLLSFYSSWNPTINNLLHYVEDGEVIEWNLYSHPPLPTWTKGQCVLIGDAAHPMLPYVAQGAAQGIEDAGVLACCLSLFEFTSGERRGVGIEDRLKIFERVRKERAERVQNSASETRRVLHLPDGEEQRARDARMRGVGKGQRLVDGEKGRNPDLWADRQWQEFMWGVDVMKVVIESWEDLVRSTLLR